MERRSDPGRWLLLAASAVVIVAGLRAAAPFLLPVLVAVFLALLSFPILSWQVERGVRVWLAVVATVLVEVAVLSAVGVLLSGALNDFARGAPGYLEQIISRTRAGLEALQERGIDLGGVFALERLDPGSLVGVARGIVGGTVRGVTTVVSYSVVVLLLLVCLLFEAVQAPRKLRQALGDSRGPEYLARVTRDVQRYLGVKTLVSVATGVVVGLWVWLLGVPFPMVWALLAFALNYIPAIGSIVAAVPAVLLTSIQFGLGRAALVALGYLLVNLLLGNMVEPVLMGRRFGLSTLAVFLALVFWGWLWGPFGMLLSVPLTMAIKILLEQSDEYRWLALLLGPAPRPAAPSA